MRSPFYVLKKCKWSQEKSRRVLTLGTTRLSTSTSSLVKSVSMREPALSIASGDHSQPGEAATNGWKPTAAFHQSLVSSDDYLPSGSTSTLLLPSATCTSSKNRGFILIELGSS